jgi:hypothetical protein
MGKRLPHAGIRRATGQSGCFAFVPLDRCKGAFEPHGKLLDLMRYWRFELQPEIDGCACYRIPLGVLGKTLLDVQTAFCRYSVKLGMTFSYAVNSVIPTPLTLGRDGGYVKRLHDANRKELHRYNVQYRAIERIRQYSPDTADAMMAMCEDGFIVSEELAGHLFNLLVCEEIPQVLRNDLAVILSALPEKDIPAKISKAVKWVSGRDEKNNAERANIDADRKGMPQNAYMSSLEFVARMQ